MWFSLIAAAVVTIAALIRSKVSKKDQSITFMLGMPLLMCLHCMVLADTAIDILADPTGMKIVSIVANILLTLPILVMLMICLYKACRYPLSRSSYTDMVQYDYDCIKRQRKMLNVVFAVSRVAALLAAIAGVITFFIVAGLALMSLHPAVLFLAIISCGIALVLYFILALGISSPFVLACAGLMVMAFLLIAEAYMIGGTLLRRAKMGYPKKEYVKMAASVMIPIWGIVRLVKLNRDLKEKGLA